MKLDELLPVYDVAARYHILVQASVSDTAAALESVDFSQAPITRALMALRTLGRKRSMQSGGTQRERLLRAGFVEVGSLPEREIVFGIVGRFWRPDSGIVKGLSAQEVLDFHAEGYAKGMWSFEIVPESANTTRVTTETRVQTFGPLARRRFRAYWFFVGPFSGLIRKEMLKIIKRDAEARARQ